MVNTESVPKKGSWLSGKNAVIFGVANEMSIAFHIAKALEREGANLCFFYYPKTKERALPAIKKFKSALVLPCDAVNEDSLKEAFDGVKAKWKQVDFVVHSIAFAHRDDLKTKFIEIPQDHFNLAMDTSAYSLISITRTFLPLMKSESSILAMTFLGGERVFSNYKVMGICKASLDAIVKYLAFELGSKGIRVNAVSAGPIKTVAASALNDFDKMLKKWGRITPLGRNIEPEDIAKAALFLLGPNSKSITGQVLHVDSGYSIMGDFPEKKHSFLGGIV